MREIKIRSWNREMNSFYEPEFNGYINNIFADGKSKGLIYQLYTGLKDRNGVEIFEGDILFNDHIEEFGEVGFGEGKFLFEGAIISADLFDVADDFEVRGNIYENPELTSYIV